ncbi:MAG: hypothetical protein Q7J06_07605 [Bacteroidales bacterium]|nr:hypothetical protein [Bacteroidales bacterium]
MYKYLILLHIITSSVFIVVAIAITVRSIAGWSKNLQYSKTDKYLRTLFMVLLYLTLVHGIIMYFFIDPASKSAVDIQHAIKRASLRFWVVEHFYIMTFALILAQIGGIFIRKTTIDKSRFAYASFYYGIATLITIISMTFYFIYR